MSFSFRKLTYWRRRLSARVTGRANVHFLHIRKAGGTALKNALKTHPSTPVAMLHLHPHRIGLRDIPSGHRFMFVVREPVSRFVSGFNSRLRQGAPANHVPWSPAEKAAFELFPTPNALALALNPAHPEHAQAKEAMQAISHLSCSYWDWFGDVELWNRRRKDVLYIGRIESFDADFALLKEALRLPAEAALPSDPKLAHRASGQKPAPLEEAALAQLRAWYRPDFEFLELCAAWRAEQGGPVARDFGHVQPRLA